MVYRKPRHGSNCGSTYQQNDSGKIQQSFTADVQLFLFFHGTSLFGIGFQICLLKLCSSSVHPMSSTYRAEKKSLQILLSRTQAGPGRKVKQEQVEISSNHVPRLFLSYVVNMIASAPKVNATSEGNLETSIKRTRPVVHEQDLLFDSQTF